MVFIDPQAGCIAKHRKLVPTAGERLAWGQGDSWVGLVHNGIANFLFACHLIVHSTRIG